MGGEVRADCCLLGISSCRVCTIRIVMRFAFRNASWSKHMNIISQPPITMTTSHNDQAPLGSYTVDRYTRGADHTANTAQGEEDSYILALHTDLEHQKRVTALRTQYFPPGLNKLPAHIALLRAPPGSQLATIQADSGAVTE